MSTALSALARGLWPSHREAKGFGNLCGQYFPTLTRLQAGPTREKPHPSSAQQGAGRTEAFYAGPRPHCIATSQTTAPWPLPRPRPRALLGLTLPAVLSLSCSGTPWSLGL